MIMNIISNQPIKYLTLYQKSNDDDFGAKIQTKLNRNLKHAKSRGKATLKGYEFFGALNRLNSFE